MKKIILFLLIIPSISFAQTNEKDSIWNPFKNFIGNWSGTGDGQSGKGTYEITYNFLFNEAFIEIKNKAIYPPSPNNKNKGEVHEDVGYISYDYSRKIFVLRQFHKEGFVNQYKLDSISTDGKTIVFITESIENIPAGWKAKETYRFISENEIEETFELAAPKAKFEVYTIINLKRK